MVHACIQWLHLNGCFIWRNNSGGYKSETGTWIRYGLTGSPDIIGVNPRGRFIGIEAKSDTGKPTDQQLAFGRKVTDRGGVYLVVRSTDELEARRNEVLG